MHGHYNEMAESLPLQNIKSFDEFVQAHMAVLRDTFCVPMDVDVERNPGIVGPIYVHQDVTHMVRMIGPQNVLNWFARPGPRLVGSLHKVGSYPLEAFFGMDRSRPEGERHYVLVLPVNQHVEVDEIVAAFREELEFGAPGGAVLH